MYRILLFILLLSMSVLGVNAVGIGGVREFTLSDGMSHDRVQGIGQDSEGFIWICTWYGLDRFDGYRFRTFRPKHPLDSNSRFRKAVLSGDSIVIETATGTFLSFSLSEYQFRVYDGGFPEGGIQLRRQFSDREGNRWQQTSAGIRVESNRIPDYKLLTNDTYSYIRCIFEDSYGRVWIAWGGNTSGGPVGETAIYDRDGAKTTVVMQGEEVCAIHEDTAHNIWLGTRRDGIRILKPKGGNSFDIYTCKSGEPGGLTSDAVFDITGDPSDRIWIATLGGGINVIDSGYDISNLHVGVPKRYPGEKYPRARSLLVANGKLYVGTDNGLLRSDLKSRGSDMSFVRLASSASVGPAEEIIHLNKAGNDEILITSFGKGVYGINIERDVIYPVAADDVAERHPVFSATEGSDHRLWVTAQTGVYCYHRLRESGREGWEIPGDFTILETQPLLDRNGYLWIATKDGVMKMPESSLGMENRSTGGMRFTEVTFDHDGTAEIRPLSPSDTIIAFDSRVGNISLTVSPMDFSLGDDYGYNWRIRELDTEWRDGRNQPMLNLPDLPSGRWTIDVKSYSEDEDSDDGMISIALSVEGHWYDVLTRHAVILVLIVLLVIVFVLWRVRAGHSNSVEETVPAAEGSADSADKIEVREKMTEASNEADKEFLDMLDRKIEESIGDKEFTLDILGSTMGMSRSVFYRRIKSLTGKSPSEYVADFRMNKAMEMLVSRPDRTVAEIAYECGFSSPQYFNNVFRKKYQISPNEWRKRGH